MMAMMGTCSGCVKSGKVHICTCVGGQASKWEHAGLRPAMQLRSGYIVYSWQRLANQDRTREQHSLCSEGGCAMTSM